MYARRGLEPRGHPARYLSEVWRLKHFDWEQGKELQLLCSTTRYSHRIHKHNNDWQEETMHLPPLVCTMVVGMA